MSSNFIPDGEAQFNAWLQNFSSKCATYATPLGLSPAELLEIQNEAEQFAFSFSEQISAKEAFRGATLQRNKDRKSATAVARAFAKEFKANPAVTPQILGQLGIVASSTSGPVTMVTNLLVSVCGGGVISLKWDRNGNAPGTMFIIEYSLNAGTSWSLAGAVGRTTFDHEGQTPGQTIWYRVISNRASMSSAPTLPVVAYPSGGETALTIAA